MKYFALIFLFTLVSCKKDIEYRISIKGSTDYECISTSYQTYEDLKNNGSFKFKTSQSLRAGRESEKIYVSSEYYVKIQLKGTDSTQYYIFKDGNMIDLRRGNFEIVIKKGKIK